VLGKTVSHYRILARVGGGGMGVVYEAEDTRLERRVALKFLSQDLVQDSSALERFRREARIVAGLNHPNICTIHDIGEHENMPFIVMELMKGEALQARFRRGPFTPQEIVELATQLAGALEAAHAQSILHRDIKPANIFLTERGQAKILDFGLAKLVPGKNAGAANQWNSQMPTAAIEHLTQTGAMMGTIAYMSPEQARGEELDTRSDLFALGVVLYEMTTGRNAFGGDTAAVIFDGILNRDPIPPGEVNPEAPTKLDEIILKLMEKDRALRYQSAAELEVDLKRLRRDSQAGRSAVRATAASRIVPEPIASPAPAPTPPPPFAPPPKKGLALKIALPVVAITVTAIAVLAMRAFRETPAPRVEPAVAPTPAAAVVPPPTTAALPTSEPVRRESQTKREDTPVVAPPSKAKSPAAPVTTSNGIEFVRILPGEFLMGSTNGADREKPVHLVKITHGFEMGKYEVTQAQWDAVFGSDKSHFKGASLPVENVSWDDVQAFILALNTRKDGFLYRLPTEAEWEYACRAGTTQDYAGNLDDLAWYEANSGAQSHPVGMKQPNAWGLYDMHGNVWEWVQDWYGEDYYQQSPAADPPGPSTGSERVERGGPWRAPAWNARSANRNNLKPTIRGDAIGFRLARNAQ
jgi:formylglycine-generating enzyme required for sulfatase activity